MQILHFNFPPVYSPEVQVRIPAALCVIHNVIQNFDPSEGGLSGDNVSFGYVGSDEEIGGTNDRSDVRSDRIAEDMWRDYQRVLAEREMVEWEDEDENYY